MNHTIISWDCCYRNFFHTAFAISQQEYRRDEFEVIYVEQRTESASNRFNHRFGLPALSDVVANLQEHISIRVLFLGDDQRSPIHWGRAVNLGIAASQGEIVSVMDGDLVLKEDFLSRLDEEHRKSSKAIVNLHRRMVPEPLGKSRDRWIEQRASFNACLEACSDRNQPLPRSVTNYGPMISARREHWHSIGGYDEHVLWSTSLSRLGEDVTKRLEIRLGTQSYLLPDMVCVHPWHPVGFRRDTFSARRMLALQGELIEWAKRHEMSDWRERLDATNALFRENRRFVERVIKSEAAQPSVTPTRRKHAMAWLSSILAGLRHREFHRIRREVKGVFRSVKSRVR